MIEPRPACCMCGMTYLQHKYTEVRFTSWTRRQASSPVVRIESSSGGEMPALLNAMSIRPYSAATSANSRWTSASLATSARTNMPSASAAADWPACTSMSTATTLAPSAASRFALASPIPLPAPVTTATRSCKRCMLLLIGRDEHVLGLSEGIKRVRAELPAQARLLEPAERGPVPDRRVRVDRQVAGLHRPGHPDRAAHVTGPDGAGQPVRRVVGELDGAGLVLERGHRHHRPEDLVGVGRRVEADRCEHGRRIPPPGAIRCAAAEGHRRAVRYIGGN